MPEQRTLGRANKVSFTREVIAAIAETTFQKCGKSASYICHNQIKLYSMLGVCFAHISHIIQ